MPMPPVALGINLGPEHLTAAYIKQDGSVVHAVEVEMPQAWKDFYIDTLQTERNSSEREKHANTPQVKSLFQTLYTSTRSAVETQLSRPVQLSLISYPQHLHGLPWMNPLCYTALEVYPEITNFLQIRSYTKSIRQAYGFNSAEGLGYEPGLDLDTVNPLLVHIEYQKAYLTVSIMAVEVEINMRERDFRVDGFGGKQFAASPAEISDLTQRFKTLIDDQIRDNRYWQTQLSDFRSIILSGEAPASEFALIHEAVIKAVPEFAGRLRSEIDPLWVAAVGAAVQAKKHAIEPPGSYVDAPG
ncbi:hypothetical protein VTL71DRAFT_16083 [Oculimacula yallundae]|uniref:Actin-like protein N-terminal domain-containing protein n=1 Tax=Oculimacula yallundae TaxID=86028 RepID=A0ABR4CDG3_9HELO